MIKVKIDYTELERRMSDKYEAIKVFNSPKNKEAVAKAVFTIAAQDFTRRMNKMALMTPKSLHHVYEWGAIGNNSKRLFEIKREAVAGGTLKVGFAFKKSKTSVPISPELSIPGKRGGMVTSKNIFRNKAEVMESGNSTNAFSSKRSKFLVFTNKRGELVFIKRPRKVTIKNPGGKYTTGAFNKRFVEYFENKSSIILALNKSGYIKSLEQGIAKAMKVDNNSTSLASKQIQEISARYSKGVNKY